ncbi:MAG: hypothetical protein KF912_09640 [Phycisphaeraceae bacterium]|nr:hypothetical protein [Phycisphaeraceae bacterium]MBX3367557.1 hypothetical protein [Phycisphaeraceae bacterium]QYK46962.1 MAG: hypothetical protein KF838_09215 [Phycisphaeraceae bacterium]
MSDRQKPTIRTSGSENRGFALPIAYPSTAITPDGDAFVPEGATPPEPPSTPARPAIGVYFECANQYVRVYRNATGSEYLARCPKCAKTMSFLVAPGGTARRMFAASCR